MQKGDCDRHRRSGLIGPSLIELLLKKYRVVSLDNYSLEKENHIEGG